MINNVSLHFFYLIALPTYHLLQAINQSPVLHLSMILFNIIILFVLPGLCLARLIYRAKSTSFVVWEFLTVATVTALLLVPSLLMIENVALGRLYTWLPLFNTIVLTLIIFFQSQPDDKKIINQIFTAANLKNILTSAWWWAFVLFALLIFRIATTYQALPEIDPYYWLDQYRNFINGAPSLLHLDRPLFYALNYIFIAVSHVDAYAYFKYVLPSLSFLVLIPATLLASRYSNRLIQASILAIPLFSPSTILYMQIPFPEAIAIILMYTFFFCLVYSEVTGKKFFYYLAGLAIFISYSYHELSSIMFSIWLAVTLYQYRYVFWNYAKHNRLIIALVGIIIASNIRFLQPPFLYIWYWLNFILKKGFGHINLKFPAAYTNIDGHEVGWTGFAGVSKYYLYYAGPVLLLLLATCVILYIKNRSYFQSWQKILKHSQSAQVIVWCTVIFLIIAEVIPRLLGIALLPDRIWIILGIFLAYLMIQLYTFTPRYSSAIAACVLILVGISVGAAIYINDAKKYVIPDYQLQSAAWIKTHLPNDRIMITTSHATLLKFHGDSEFISVQDSLFCDQTMGDTNALLDAISLGTHPISTKQPIIDNTVTAFTNYLQTHTAPSLPEITTLLTPYVAQLNTEPQAPNNTNNKHVYIYYATADPRNPYAARPYAQKDSLCTKPIFFNYPNAYTPVYNDGGRVVIWSVK